MEGYWGPLKWIRVFKNNQLAAYDADQKNQADLKKVSDDTYAAEKLAEKSGTATDEYRQAKKASDAAWEAYWNAVRDARLAFPRERKHVLPTRFGNILRAFETYSYDVYGIDSIPGWLRLSGVIPEDFQKLIANARAEVDFFLNNCLLLSAIGVVTLIATVWSVMGLWLPLAAPDFHISWLLAGEVAPVLAVACYHMAVSRAPAWGNLVRSAFDLYLPNLAKQMGYALPATLGEQTRFWKKIDDMFLYSKPVPDVFRRPPPPADDDKSG
jgi:hypothetical protein